MAVLPFPPAGKSGGGSSKKKSIMLFLAGELYKVLPAKSRADIADKLARRLHRPVSIGFVDRLLGWCRKNADELGWCPFYSARGLNVTNEDRFIVVHKHRDPRGDVHTDEEHASVNAGNFTNLKHVITTTGQLQTMLIFLAARTAGRKYPRLLRERATDLGYIHDKIVSVLEELEEENGA